MWSIEVKAVKMAAAITHNMTANSRDELVCAADASALKVTHDGSSEDETE
jgi:hypothetical protein